MNIEKMLSEFKLLKSGEVKYTTLQQDSNDKEQKKEEEYLVRPSIVLKAN